MVEDSHFLWLYALDLLPTLPTRTRVSGSKG